MQGGTGSGGAGTGTGTTDREYVGLSNDAVESRTRIEGLQREVDDIARREGDLVRSMEDMQKAISAQDSATATTRWIFGFGLSAIIGLGSFFSFKKQR